MATSEKADSEVQPSRKVSAGKFVLVCVVAVLLLFMVVFAIGSFVSARQLQSELDQIKAAGEPLTVADLDAFYAYPPKDRDTTQLWLGAFAVLDSPGYQGDAKLLPIVGEGVAIPAPGELWPHLDAAEALLAKYREPLEKMHEAAELGGQARFPVKFSDGIATLLPHVQQIRVGSRLLRLEAEIHARHGDPRAAARPVRAIFAAARSLEKEPIIVSQLVRIALNGVACEQIERLMPAGDFSDEELLQFDRELAAIDDEAAYRRSLLGERAIGILTFENLAVVGALGQQAPSGLRIRLLGKADEAAYLQLMGKFVAASQSKTLPLREAMLQTQDEVTGLLNSSQARWRYPLTKLLMPTLQASTQAVCRAQALQSATRTAIAIERYRRIHGQPPDALDQLTPDFLGNSPLDPFDGAPLRYRADATGYKVYSIGADGIDQGGDAGGAGQMLDVVFKVEYKK